MKTKYWLLVVINFWCWWCPWNTLFGWFNKSQPSVSYSNPNAQRNIKNTKKDTFNLVTFHMLQLPLLKDSCRYCACKLQLWCVLESLVAWGCAYVPCTLSVCLVLRWSSRSHSRKQFFNL